MARTVITAHDDDILIKPDPNKIDQEEYEEFLDDLEDMLEDYEEEDYA